jgi:integrase
VTPAWIRPRLNRDGSKSYQVLYRRGGRNKPIATAGSFRGWPSGRKADGQPAAALTKAEQDARVRRDLVAGWLAQGLDPTVELARLSAAAAPVRVRSRDEWRDRWLASRHDIDPKSERTYRSGITAVYKRLEAVDLLAVTAQDCQDTIAKLTADYAPSTVGNYWTAFVMLLDYVGLEPNPAQHKSVRLPRIRRVPPVVPTREHVEAMLHRLGRKYLLPFALLEQTAARVETIEQLAWGSVDVPGSRLRLLEKGAKYRFVPMPDWLAAMIDATCPPEDRTPERRVFPGVSAGGLRGAMAGACAQAGIPHYHPHDLRHRRASLWHLQSIPDAVLADRLGHEKASFSKDVYVHVMPTEEVPLSTWKAVLA